MHELGVMDLDAYTSGQPATATYPQSTASWLARATNPMPEPGTALAGAVHFLTEATTLRSEAQGARRNAMSHFGVLFDYHVRDPPERRFVPCSVTMTSCESGSSSITDFIKRTRVL
jgi:hypothetical protein